MFAKLLPLGGEFIIEIIKYSMCFACGMFIYRIPQPSRGVANGSTIGSSNDNKKFENNK